MIGINKGVASHSDNTLSLHSKLESSGYFCSPELATKVELAMLNKPVAGAIIQGSTGSGKTFLPESLSKALGYELLYFQCQVHTDEMDLIQKMIPDESSISGIKLQDNVLLNAIKKSVDNKVILCIDEYDKSRPSADTVMLEFLQRGGIWHNNYDYQGNLDNLIIFLCCNEERELSDFIKRRLPHIFFEKIEPAIVQRVLSTVKANQKFVNLALAIYRATYESFPKIITTQELIQFINACSVSQNYRNLAYQFLVKSKDLMGEFESQLSIAKINLKEASANISPIIPATALSPKSKTDIYEKFLKRVSVKKRIKSPDYSYDLTNAKSVNLAEYGHTGVFEYNPNMYTMLVNPDNEKTNGVILDTSLQIELVSYDNDYFIVIDADFDKDVEKVAESLYATVCPSNGQMVIRAPYSYSNSTPINEYIQRYLKNMDSVILYSDKDEVIFTIFHSSALPIQCRYETNSCTIECVLNFVEGMNLELYYKGAVHDSANIFKIWES